MAAVPPARRYLSLGSHVVYRKLPCVNRVPWLRWTWTHSS